MTLDLRIDNPYSIGNIFQFPEWDSELVRDPLFYTPSILDEYHTVIYGETLGSIAFDKYGNSKEWWVIADVNNIFWPFELDPGTVLIIPDLNKINLQR